MSRTAQAHKPNALQRVVTSTLDWLSTSPAMLLGIVIIGTTLATLGMFGVIFYVICIQLA